MRFSIITPAYNIEQFIAQTIESVLSQEGDFEIEYIVVDGNSTDKTAAIVQTYVQKVESGAYPLLAKKVSMHLLVQTGKDGMYQAINQGFKAATGDIYAWINGDDVYQPGAFAAIAKTFNAFPEILWLKGITDVLDAQGVATRNGQCMLYRQDWTAQGIYGQEAYFIQQDSVFWRKSLWEKVGSIAPQYRLAGDYWLWIEFAKYAPLWSLNVRVSFFRRHEAQLSRNTMAYKGEQRTIRPKRTPAAWEARLFFVPQ